MPTRISIAGDEPVTLADVKLAARVDDDLGAASSLDAIIATLIATAREQAEHLTGRCYRPQVVRCELSDWPAASTALPVFQATACVVRYWSGSGWEVLDESSYAYAPGGPGAVGTVLAPELGTAWPALSTRAAGSRVQIDLTAGPESPADVPACVKTYIAAAVAAWLKTPEATAAATLGPHPLFVGLLHAESLFA